MDVDLLWPFDDPRPKPYVIEYANQVGVAHYPGHADRGELLGRSLLLYAPSEHYPQLWPPTLDYERALALVDWANFNADIVRSTLRNEEREPSKEMDSSARLPVLRKSSRIAAP